MIFDSSHSRLATLIVNPAAGKAALLDRRLAAIEALLARHRLQLRVVHTTPEPDSAERLGRVSVKDSALVLACGGDGTVHGVLQGLARTDATFGVLPLGTANALARYLKLPLDPLAAMESLLAARRRRVAVGMIETDSLSRYFLVMAGCGPDGALAHSLSSEAATRFKRRFGRSSYYVQAGRLFVTRGWPSFRVEYRTGETWAATTACAVLASRLPDLGGLFSGLTRGANFHAPTLHLQVIAPPRIFPSQRGSRWAVQGFVSRFIERSMSMSFAARHRSKPRRTFRPTPSLWGGCHSPRASCPAH